MLGSKTKRELKRNQRRILIDSIEIGIPSPQQIQSWGERQLPNGKKVGEVKNSKTVNYKRFTPLRDGLFCERIFGPVNSWVCACGKRQVRADWSYCDKCEVEYTDQRTRRNRLGFISLVSPVAHIWYLKGRPSYLSLFLGKRKKKVVQLVYCNAYLVEAGSPLKSLSSQAFVPGGVMAEMKQREAHGIEKYKKNIRSKVATRQLSNVFYKDTTNKLALKYTQHTVSPISKNKAQTLVDTNSLFLTPTFKRTPNFLSSAEIPKNINSFQSLDTLKFKKDINQKTSPSSFFNLLVEVLGYIEKNLLLSNELKIKSRKVETNLSFLSGRKVEVFNNASKKEKNPFALRAVWTYTYSRNDIKGFNEVHNFRFREKKSTENIIGEQIFDFSNSNSIVYDYLKYAQKRNSIFNNFAFYKSCFDLTPTIFSFASQTNVSCNPIFGKSNHTFDKKYSKYTADAKQIPLSSFQSQFVNSIKFKEDNPISQKIERSTQFENRLKLKRNGSYAYASLAKQMQALYENTSVANGSHGNTIFSSFLPDKKLTGVNWKKSNYDFSYRTDIKTIAQTPDQSVGLYNRAHTFPFLPDLICKYNLRDELLNFLNSSPHLEKSSNLKEDTSKQDSNAIFGDKPIPLYCKIERWQPLRDVHKFMSEQVLAQFYKKERHESSSVLMKVGKSNSLDKNKYTTLFKEKTSLSWKVWAQSQFTKELFVINELIQKRLLAIHAKRACISPAMQSAALQAMHAKRAMHAKVCKQSNTVEMLFVNSFYKNTKEIKDNVLLLRLHDINYLGWISAREKRYQAVLVGIDVLIREFLFSIQASHVLNVWHASSGLQQIQCIPLFLQSRTLGRLQKPFETINPSLSAKDFVTVETAAKNKKNVFDLLAKHSFASSESDFSKMFLESEHAPIDEMSSDLLEAKKNLDSKTLPINGFTITNPKLKASPTVLPRKRDKAQNTILFKNVDSYNNVGPYNKEYAQLEKLSSLRHVLYMALLEKSYSIKDLQTNKSQGNKAILATKISQMFVLFTQMSRENLIYDTIRLAKRKNLSTKISSSKSEINSFSFVLDPEFGKKRLSQSIGFVNYHLQETHGVTKRFYATQYLTNQENSFYHLTGIEYSALQTSLASMQNRVMHAYRGKYSELVLLAKLKGFIGLANTLQLNSPEKSYRSLLLDKTWVRSFLLKKHWLEQQNNHKIKKTELFYSTNSDKNTSWKSNSIRLWQQTRIVPSLLYPFLQSFENKKPFLFYSGIIDNTWIKKNKPKLWKQKSFLINTETTGEDVIEQDTLAQANVSRNFAINRKDSYVLYPLNTLNFVKNNCALLKKYAQKSVSRFEKRFIHSVYNSTFVITEKNTKKDTFVSSDLVQEQSLHTLPAKTQLGNNSLPFFSDSNANSEQLKLFLPRVFFDMFGYNRLEDFTKALSFFLILPQSQKKELKTVEKSMSLQVQILNGNSQLVDIPREFLKTYYHHTNALINKSGTSNCSDFYTSTFYQSETVDDEHVQFTKDLRETKKAPTLFTKTSEIFQKNLENTQSYPFRFHLERAYKKEMRDHFSLYPKGNEELAEHINTSKSSNTLPAKLRMQSYALHATRASQASRKNERFVPSEQSAITRQNNSLSPIDVTTIREILSYTGGGALQKLLQRFDTQLFQVFLFHDIQSTRALYKKRISEKSYPPSRIEKRALTRICRRIYKNSRRFKLAQLLTRSKRRPEWMMISILPVLPPDLRPILQMSESVVVASDLNNLYQRVIYRNNRFHKLGFIDFHLVTAIQRLVQDAVDRLIENGKGGSKPFYTPSGRPLRSLSDQLKGKKGRFRLNLLGKRVDFSGRSVIVVSPHLKIHECGLPREIALELYHYFLLRQFILKKQASSIVMAKKIIKQKKPLMWDALRDIIYHHPVLLNRAPTLHRLGIQAFQPQLVQGNAILLHPLVCSGFNADFDGDQMGVHLPLCTQARAEAWDLLWSRNNLLSPATGQPVLVPSQDMVLGFYYITQLFPARSLTVFDYKNSNDSTTNKNLRETYKNISKPNVRTIERSKQVFSNIFQLLQAFQNKQLEIHQPVWLQWTDKMENDEISQKPVELRLNTFGSSTYIYPRYKRRRDEAVRESNLFIRTTAGRVLVHAIVFPR